MAGQKTYLTVQEVAKRFGINATTVYRLAQRGKLPGFKVGNQWRFSERRLEEWVADRERVG
jgi:excisionase family DNA binding protein